MDVLRIDSNSLLVHHLRAFSEKIKLSLLKSAILKCVCNALTLSARKEPQQCQCCLFLSFVLFLSCGQSGCDQSDFTVVSLVVECVDIGPFPVQETMS